MDHSNRLSYSKLHPLRTKANEDTKFISNRISFLQQHERKLWKKIEHSKKRVDDVLEGRKNKETQLSQKSQTQLIEEDSRLRQQETFRRVQENRRSAIDEKKINILLGKKEEAKQVRDTNKQRRRQQLESIYHGTVELRNTIRERKSSAARKSRNFKLKQVERVKIEYAKKLVNEKKLLKQAETRISTLELKELDLIQKLQYTKTLQKDAFSKLTSVLNEDLTKSYK